MKNLFIKSDEKAFFVNTARIRTAILMCDPVFESPEDVQFVTVRLKVREYDAIEISNNLGRPKVWSKCEQTHQKFRLLRSYFLVGSDEHVIQFTYTYAVFASFTAKDKSWRQLLLQRRVSAIGKNREFGLLTGKPEKTDKSLKVNVSMKRINKTFQS